MYLDDEEAVHRMNQEIDLQSRGDLRQRLSKATYGDTGLISIKQFNKFVKEDLCMSDNDLLRLQRVSKFADLKTRDKIMQVETLLANFHDRVKQS